MPEREEPSIAHCRSCAAPIKWLRTTGGKWMPVNLETVEESDTVFEHGRHLSHFATCPEHHRWRRRR
jgi:hypothetical protein